MIAYEFLRPISGVIVDKKHFEIGESLVSQGGEASLQMVTSIPVGDDDRDNGRHDSTS
jgi:hypothetical protein